MIYLTLYLAIGLVVLAIVLGQHLLTPRYRSRDEVYELLEQLRGKPSIGKRLLENIVVPVLAGILVVVAWPVAMVYLAKSVHLRPNARDANSSGGLQVTDEDLRNRLSIADIERRELVIDPLGAAPEVPLGFLNEQWLSFRDSLKANDEVWSFSTEQCMYTNFIQQTSGYVVRRQGEFGPHIVTGQLTYECSDDGSEVLPSWSQE
jgi:hypothetical protein